MTIQPSVTLWTILCFLALMVILDRLLFRPMLGFMDRRQARIDAAREAKAAAQRERERALAAREEDRVAAEKQAMQDASEALAALGEENARRFAERKAENERRFTALDAELSAESEEILSYARAHTGELAAVIAACLHRPVSAPAAKDGK